MAGIYDEQILGAQQQAETARKLREGVSAPQGQMVSGWYVPPSITQYMAEALKGYNASQDEKKYRGEYEAAKTRKDTETAEIMRQLQPQANVSLNPSVSENFGNPEAMAQGFAQGGTQTTFTQPDERTRMAALLRGSSVNPDAFKSQIEMAKFEMGLEDKEAARKQSEMLRREGWGQQQELAKINASLRPEKMVTVIDTASGMPVSVPQSQMQSGMTIYTPSAAKAITEKSDKEKGKKDLTDSLGQMVLDYQSLKDKGGIVSPKSPWYENVGARVASTGMGQFTGQLLGTEEQTLRENIDNARPLILQAIKNATGMTAQQMNSDADIKMWMKTTSDPSASYESNIQQLKVLDKKYGLGLGFDSVDGGDAWSDL